MAATSTMRALAPAPAPTGNTHTAPRRRTLAIAASSPTAAQRPLKPLLAAAPGPSTSKQPVLAPAPATQRRPALLPLAPAKARSPQPRAPSTPARTTTTITSPPLSRHESVSASNVKPMTTANVAGLSSAADETSSYDSASSLSGSALDVDEDGCSGNNGVIQPQKEWVLPARAKPGRKPSDVEPPTKRKAQNRASQRAFRERRQSYLASLETKVAEYERNGASVSAELQRVARRLKEENEALKSANEALRTKVQRYETMHAESQSLVKAENDGIMTPPSAGGSGGGMPVSMMLSAPRRSSWDWSKTSPTAEPIDGAAPGEPQSSSSAGAVGCGTIDRDCGFCTEQSLCVCSGEAVLDFSESTVKNAHRPSPEKQSRSSPLKTAPAAVSVPLRRRNDGAARPSEGERVPVASRSAIWPTQPLRPTLTFEQQQRQSSRFAPLHIALPRRAGKLWPIYPTPATPTSTSPASPTPAVFRMRKQLPGAPAPVCSGDPSDCGACATDPALAAFCRAVSAHLTNATPSATQTTFLDAGNAVPLRRKRTYSGTLTDAHSASKPGSLRSLAPPPPPPASTQQVRSMHLYTNGGGGSSSPLTLQRSNDGRSTAPRPKLWTVSRSDEWSAQTVSAPRVQPLATPPGVESIPEAWQRIKQHPRFSQWQGGLDMLADVVTRRPDGGREDDEDRRASIAPRPSSFAQKFWHGSSSADRGAVGEQEEGSTRSHAKEQREKSASPPPDEPTSKRRKLYVERKRVDDVLALMDKATAQARQSTSSSPPTTEQAEPQACACPLSKIM